MLLVASFSYLPLAINFSSLDGRNGSARQGAERRLSLDLRLRENRINTAFYAMFCGESWTKELTCQQNNHCHSGVAHFDCFRNLASELNRARGQSEYAVDLDKVEYRDNTSMERMLSRLASNPGRMVTGKFNIKSLRPLRWQDLFDFRSKKYVGMTFVPNRTISSGSTSRLSSPVPANTASDWGSSFPSSPESSAVLPH